MLDVLKNVHRQQLGRFIFVPDKVQFDVKDKWPKEENIPDPPEIFREDCDGFSFACKKHLKQLGIKSRVVICVTETAEIHMVCEVDGWILDNRQRKVMSKDQMKYSWIAISGYEGGDQWHIING